MYLKNLFAADWQKFYKNIPTYCTREAPFKLHSAIIALIVIIPLALLFILFVYLALRYGRYREY